MLLFFLSLALNFHAQQSFYIVRRFFSPRYSSRPTPFVVDFPSGRFFSPRSPIISPSAGCPSSSWSFARLSVAYTLISRLTQSLCSCLLLSLLRAAVDLSLLPARRPSCLRDSVLLVCLHSSSHLFLSLSLSLSPSFFESNSILLRLRRTCSSSQSVAGRPDCPQEVRHHRRRHRRNRARAVRQVYGGDTKRKKGRIPTAIVGP